MPGLVGVLFGVTLGFCLGLPIGMQGGFGHPHSQRATCSVPTNPVGCLNPAGYGATPIRGQVMDSVRGLVFEER